MVWDMKSLREQWNSKNLHFFLPRPAQKRGVGEREEGDETHLQFCLRFVALANSQIFHFHLHSFIFSPTPCVCV